ncbi:hypothetical protein AAFF_G00025280 [Aldrovandia affinis]|uniref:Uncharacterized protein n=1 Tax=Aldrovandia affinis TaxID=143900 RepID=A0AAD7WG93_9TELE|nr:hypothetical protein AAFF_G00025280 [Aldrovandia affinis]
MNQAGGLRLVTTPSARTIVLSLSLCYTPDFTEGQRTINISRAARKPRLSWTMPLLRHFVSYLMTALNRHQPHLRHPGHPARTLHIYSRRLRHSHHTALNRFDDLIRLGSPGPVSRL